MLGALTLVVGRFGTRYGFCTLNNGKIHAFLVSVPFLLVVAFSLYVHCKYGSQAYLKLFSKNYIRFRNIFWFHRLYITLYVLFNWPLLLHFPGFLFMHGWSLVLSPISICTVFITSVIYR